MHALHVITNKYEKVNAEAKVLSYKWVLIYISYPIFKVRHYVKF